MDEEKLHEEVHQEQQPEPPAGASHSRQWGAVGAFLLILAMGLTLAYAWRQHRLAEDLASNRDELKASLSQTQSQVDTLNARISSLMASQAAAQASGSTTGEQSVSTPKVRHRPARRASAKRAADDPRWKKVQAELDEHQKQLQETQASVQQTRTELESNLQSTRDELNGSIAKNHDELVALEKRGERNYYEFDLNKSKQFRREGPISVSLRKANTKHDYCDLELMVDDNQLSKKHVNLDEPVLFYPEGFPSAVEIVINSISKNHAHGYVSEPKYKEREQTSSAPASAPAPATPTAAATLDHRPETE